MLGLPAVVCSFVTAVIAMFALPSAGFAEHVEGGASANVVAGGAFVKIREVHPKPRSRCIGLGLTILGWKMYPKEIGKRALRVNGGHYRLYVNGKLRARQANPRYASACGLTPGRTYRLRVVLAYNNGDELAARSQLVTAVLR